MNTYILGLTGASGSAYFLRTAQALLDAGHALRVVASATGVQVLAYETGVDLSAWAKARPNVILEDNADLFSPIASGSRSFDGMAVVPCSMSTLGLLAHGITETLLTRAADVMLKQRRPLVLMARETPLTSIHLQNMLTLSQCGAIILPAMPGFYSRPQTLDDAVDFMAGKVLDCLGVDHHLYKRWRETE